MRLSVSRNILLAIAASLALALPGRAVAGSHHAHTRPLVVVLDPGHGGDDSGAASADGTLLEKTMTLAVARLAARDLQRLGFRVYLTRTRDQAVNTPPRDLNHDGKIDHVDELDARNLFANRHHADLFVSIHFDGSGDSSVHGTHGYYCPARPFWRNSRRLADLLTASLSSSLHAAALDDPNLGVQTDVADVIPQTRADYPWFLVLGPSLKRFITGSAMPGALIETLFMSSPHDDAIMRKPSGLAALARGYTEGILAYFNGKSSR
ncbi:MAG TPA: N-acetylmuramoyl-L-alanine amidase [Chloroflexota bacterium]|nr:N-acetylmuramoyl-L-alanine amidase [Chloroflexota bacterium]